MHNSRSKYTSWGSFVIFTILPLLSSSYLTYYLFQHQEIIAEWGFNTWLLYSFLLAVLCAIAIIPPTLLALVMGFFAGWKAFPLLVLINMLAIVLIYGFSRLVDFSFVRNWLNKDPKVVQVMNRIREDELKVIFFTKLSPLFPFAVTNLIFAASGAKFRSILVGGFLGMIPRTLLAVYVGTQGKELQQLMEDPNGGSLGQWTVISLILISIGGLYLTFKKK
ncbi:TVP38/TMEM64 family protein [Leadbetterella byssophila]|jgi:uncharacterized membrane protein YdjX (TVP38/TMEM64 family)|uniref:TVP38/TMEM64 family membrane protein n=1 Tax=Leadbetterella byssophila (strain DSM 17132 / JCM 16389 / KACC 11308 / NBRC 106382 / 4M15) TaxID=649349 RepID=E4RSJ2_LEAB4|nr:VTT domain-containing protein [Leadbetterella byssophila]ADQ18562.1 SNARE associated Golgi protein-like protein [Leadbetterella byssophila DSM 17132]